MRQITYFVLLILLIATAACNSNRMTDEQIDSLNRASADSLLQDALEDTMAVDGLRTDSIKP